MNRRSTDSRTRVDLEPADGTSTELVPTSQRRIIPVGDAKTIVVQPRIPAHYKAMIWFSFALNALLLLGLLIGGIIGLNMYRQVQGQLQAAQTGLDMETSAGQRLQELREEPAGAINTARYSLGELMTSIEGLQSARIRTIIPIDRQLPINLEVPVSQETAVRTTEAVPLVAPARFTLPAGGGVINGTVALSLPAGMELPVNLNMAIPISETVPVQIEVPVDIAMQDTELADDFNRLHSLVEPAAKLVRAR